jgi:hypothetical protein
MQFKGFFKVSLSLAAETRAEHRHAPVPRGRRVDGDQSLRPVQCRDSLLRSLQHHEAAAIVEVVFTGGIIKIDRRGKGLSSILKESPPDLFQAPS